MIYVLAFWRDTFERCVRTFAQTTLGALPVSYLPKVAIPWWAALAAGGFAALLCLLTCLAGAQTGSPASASFLAEPAPKAKRKRRDAGHFDFLGAVLVVLVGVVALVGLTIVLLLLDPAFAR